MALYLRAVEVETGKWECRQGRHSFATAFDLDSALRILKAKSEDDAADGPFVLYVHRIDGVVSVAR